jgi:hypothetical protein
MLPGAGSNNFDLNRGASHLAFPTVERRVLVFGLNCEQFRLQQTGTTASLES